MYEDNILAEIKIVSRTELGTGWPQIKATVTFGAKTVDELRSVQSAILQVVENINKNEQEIINSVNNLKSKL